MHEYPVQLYVPGYGTVFLSEFDETDLKGHGTDSQDIYHLKVGKPHLQKRHKIFFYWWHHHFYYESVTRKIKV